VILRHNGTIRFFRVLEVVKLLQNFLPNPQNLRLEHWQLGQPDHHLQAVVASTQTMAQCPVCQQSSRRLSQYYCRAIYDTINNYQAGATRFKVMSLDGLSFADSANGAQIFQRGDLLAIVANQSASVFSSSMSSIFFV
jgi:hypothetical protein